MAFWDRMTPGDPVSHVFLLREFQVGLGKNGKRYLTLTLGTRDGEIEAKLWDDVSAIEPDLSRNVPVRVEGTLTSYRDKLQVTVRTMVRLAWSDELFSELVSASRFPRSELEGGVRSMLQTISNPWIRRLGDLLLSEPVATRFFESPAAKGMHHAYVRGLSEHTLSMMRVADALHQHYDLQFEGLLSRDELLMGVLLHDMGKTIEYTYHQGIDISVRGRLVGHLALGLMMLNDAMASMPGFPDDLADRLRHLILAHHGEPEKGSPVWPITAEALLLHHIDHLDAEMNAVGSLILQAESDEMTPFNTKFSRRFLNPCARHNSEAGVAPAFVPTLAPDAAPLPPPSVASNPLPIEPLEPIAPSPEAPMEPSSDFDESAKPKPRPKKGPSGPSLL